MDKLEELKLALGALKVAIATSGILTSDHSGRRILSLPMEPVERVFDVLASLESDWTASDQELSNEGAKCAT
jgi:hypothetical protein